ncbi:MAG: hypothetical protein PHC34_04495 [Candidatus Gastranaerophilales bacterium]|nr:hypothetical protein [Candidatus Gastranaerophilales bacterium]
MKKVVFSLALATLAFGYAATANAATSASQTITGTLNPFVSVSTVEGATTSISINNDGTLSTNLTPGFKFTSNNKTGASATFTVKVNTSDGNQVDAIAGTSNSTNGKIVLANASTLPLAASVRDALTDAPTVENNANAISYTVSFSVDNTNNGDVPLFDTTGNAVSGTVLKKNGTSQITMNIDKSVRTNTYSVDDVAGSYQATIYCTSATL